VIVRKILPQEMDATINLFNYYVDQAVESIPSISEEYDENSVLEFIRLYATHNEYVWMNAYEGQRPIGLIAGCVTQCPWNKDIFHGHIDMVFLLESHRNLDNFRSLLDAFTAWAKANKCTKLTAGDIGIDPARLKKLYEHFGFKEALLMVKELPE